MIQNLDKIIDCVKRPYNSDYHKSYYLKNKDKLDARQKEYSKKYPEKIRNFQKNYRANIKKNIHEILGNKCIKCGFSDNRALHIDHVHNDGYRDPLKRGSTYYYLEVKKSALKKENKYQLLCANCNIIKMFEDRGFGVVI